MPIADSQVSLIQVWWVFIISNMFCFTCELKLVLIPVRLDDLFDVPLRGVIETPFVCHFELSYSLSKLDLHLDTKLSNHNKLNLLKQNIFFKSYLCSGYKIDY